MSMTDAVSLTDISVVKGLLSEHGFRFSKALGQNFLTADWVPEKITAEAGVDKETGVLEIGPGIGCLTEKLAERAARVLSVELDGRLKPVLAQSLSAYDNIEIIFADILKLNLAETLREKLPCRKLASCANLPYNITTPAIAALLRDRLFKTVTVMIQREVAERICAAPGTAAYGAFTVFCSWYAKPRILFDVSPGCFIPPPKVVSSVLRFDVSDKPPYEVKDEALFFRVVRAAFGQRRKTLLNALAGGIPDLSRAAIAEAIAALGADEKIRGERLGTGQFARLSDLLYNSRIK